MRAGKYIKQVEGYRAFIPAPLPPQPPIAMDAELTGLLSEADHALGRLDGVTSILPNPDLFVSMYVRHEAVLSSQIEGTQSTLEDVLQFEMDAKGQEHPKDVEEVVNYVLAMNYGLKRLDALALSLRLIREIHEKLLQGVRGANRTPGEFRRSQNWIGGSRPGNAVFVPPPPELLNDCLNQFELFLHDEQTGLPLLIKAGLVQVQFETIHPFLDGNGRLGRLLITFLLCAKDALREPILYLSLYFKTNRAAYYELLDRVRTKGDWEAWLDFFLVGVRNTAEQAASASREILALFNRDREKIETLGRPAASVLRVFQHMQRNPIIAIPSAAKRIGISAPTVAKSLGHMIDLGILEETTGRERHRLFVYRRYLDILNEGTEPLR